MPDKLCPWEKLYKRRTTSLPLPFMMPGFHHRNRKNKTESKSQRCFHLKTGDDHSSTTHKILLPSRVCSYFSDVTWGYCCAPFVGEVLTSGGKVFCGFGSGGIGSGTYCGNCNWQCSLPHCVGEGGGRGAYVYSWSGDIGGGHCGGEGGGSSGDSARWGKGGGGSVWGVSPTPPLE